MCSRISRPGRVWQWSGSALILLPFLAQFGCRFGGSSSTVTISVSPSATAPAQTHPDGPGQEWTEVGRPRKFVSQDLFNHIDGAAELFLELGFREAVVRRYANGDATLSYEIYEMKDATAARGIYLHFRGRGTPVAGVAGRNVGNRSQIVAQQDRFFIQITNITGEEQSLPAMVKLVNQATAAIPNDADVPLLSLLPAKDLVPGSEVVVRGPYSLQSVCTLGEGDILQLQGERCGIAADYKTEEEGSFTRLIVAYGCPEVAQAAFKHLLQGLDSQLQVLRRDDHGAVFRDFNGQFGSVTATGDKLDIRLHLVREPGAANPP